MGELLLRVAATRAPAAVLFTCLVHRGALVPTPVSGPQHALGVCLLNSVTLDRTGGP